MLASSLTQKEGRDRTRVSKRLVVMPHELLQQLNRARSYNELVMVRPESIRDPTSERTLIKSLHILKPNRESFNGSVHQFGHQPHDRAGVDAAAEKCAERDV